MITLVGGPKVDQGSHLSISEFEIFFRLSDILYLWLLLDGNNTYLWI